MAWDLEIRLSGGASNADPALSLGGAMSSTVLGADAATWSGSPIAGVALVHGRGNPSGSGTLVFTHGSPDHTLKWQPPGSLAPFERAITIAGGADGRYLLDTFDHRGLVVDVTAASLPGADASAGVSIAAALGNIFPDVPASESLTGSATHRCLYLKNASATLTHGLVLFVQAQPGAGELLAIGLDPAGVNATAPALAAPENEPAGVSFVMPTSAADAYALSVVLAPGDFAALWLRRAVPPVNLTSLAQDLSRVGIFSVSY